MPLLSKRSSAQCVPLRDKMVRGPDHFGQSFMFRPKKLYSSSKTSCLGTKECDLALIQLSKYYFVFSVATALSSVAIFLAISN